MVWVHFKVNSIAQHSSLEHGLSGRLQKLNSISQVLSSTPPSTIMREHVDALLTWFIARICAHNTNGDTPGLSFYYT